MKRVGKVTMYLRLEKVILDKSKQQNDMFVCYFRDNLNRLYRHYISFNKRSQIWLYNVLFGTGVQADFESLAMDLEVFHTDPFEKSRGKIFRCVVVYDPKFGAIVNEVYDLAKNFLNKEKSEEMYKNGYWHDILASKTGYCKSVDDTDFPLCYFFEEHE